MPRWAGPYTLTESIGKVAYKFTLPAQMAMHPVFYMSLLQPYWKGGRVQPPSLFFVHCQVHSHFLYQSVLRCYPLDLLSV